MPIIISNKEGQAFDESSIQTSEHVSVESIPTEKNDPIQIRVYNTKNNNIESIELETYTALALSALSQDGVHEEALKALAIAIRSVICSRHESPIHEGFELCTDENCCYALAESVSSDCLKAVEDTNGLILTYNNKAALCLSHLSSCICTESYSYVFGNDLKYLKSVSVLDESEFDYYKTQKYISIEEYKKAFEKYNTDFNNDNYVGEITHTAGGRVYTIEVGGLCFKGSTFASIFELPSTCFTVKESINGLIISSYGVGNGVGMSRSTAFLMASEGKSYKEILSHFYSDTQLSHLYTE